MAISSWKKSKILFGQSKLRSGASAQLAEGALLKLVVMVTDARRNGLMMLFDRLAMLFLIRVILHAYLRSSFFSGERFWGLERGKPELEKHSPVPPC